MAIGPIITLITDFGLTDFYVAAMKAVLLQNCPNATLIDVTHQVDRHDVRSASFTVERAVSSFGNGTIHLAVVDPGVGTSRRLIVVKINDSVVICPDNGLITWAWRNHPDATAYELSWRPESTGNTFHGRDIMAPVAGKIAAGEPIDHFTGPAATPFLFDMSLSATAAGEVIHIDHFGNATTNLPAGLLGEELKYLRLESELTVCIGQTYSDVAEGQAIALVGSSGLLEIALRNGSAAADLKLQIGDRFTLVS